MGNNDEELNADAYQNVDHSFNVRLAMLYGFEIALFMRHFWFWLEKNREKKRGFYKNKFWTYQTLIYMRKCFPYMSVFKIRRVLKDMESKGLLLIGEFNPQKLNHTKWYAFTQKGYEEAKRAYQKENDNNEKENEKEIYMTEIEKERVQKVITFFNEKTSKNFQINDNQVSKPILNLIRSNIDESIFAYIIEVKSEEWLGLKKAEGWIRPITFFGKNYERYLGQSKKDGTNYESFKKARRESEFLW